VRAYEESKRYQVVLKVGFDRQKTIAPKSGDVAIDTGAYVSPTLDHIKVQGFLVHELEIVWFVCVFCGWNIYAYIILKFGKTFIYDNQKCSLRKS
jgi:hypothetical protein